MVMYIAQAIGWGWSWVLRRPRNQPISHRELAHAHWDPIARRWLTHSDMHESAPTRAA